MYAVRAKGIQDGEYTLSYGKGSKKLVSTIKREVNGIWIVTYSDGREVGGYKTMRAGKEQWGSWAEAKYNAGTNDEATTPDGSSDSSTNTAEPSLARPSIPAVEEDELNERERAFFETLSQKRGRLNEWQRSQCKLILRTLCGLPENPVAGYALKASECKGFPTTQKRELYEHVEKPVRSNSTPPKHKARGAGQEIQVPPIPRHTPKPRTALATAVASGASDVSREADEGKAVSENHRAIHDGTAT